MLPARNSSISDTSDPIAKKVRIARQSLEQAVAAFNAQNVLNCGDECYNRMREMLDYIQSGKDAENAPWMFKSKKSKTVRKIEDEDWEM